MSRVEKIRRFYRSRLQENRREHYDILDWASADSQYARFAELGKIIAEKFAENEEIRLLDVGCGFADLAVYLRESPRLAKRKIIYTGVDLTAEILTAARREHPDLNLCGGDIFTDDSLFGDREFSVVFCSGIFNLKLGNNMDFAVDGMQRLKKFTARLLVANFLHRRAEVRYGECFYFEPRELLTAIIDHEWHFSVRENYLPNDFTIVAERKRRSLHN